MGSSRRGSMPRLDDEDGEQDLEQQQLTPHPGTDPEKTRRFLHPTQATLLSPADALHYNNMAFITQQNRFTHELLETMIARNARVARSASVSSHATGSAPGTPRPSADLTINPEEIFEQHKDYFLAAFKIWTVDKQKPVRKIRGKTGNTEKDANEFLDAHLEELEDEKPPELVVTLTDLQGDEHEVDRTELFLTISKAYSKQVNPMARGTKGTAGNSKKPKPSPLKKPEKRKASRSSIGATSKSKKAKISADADEEDEEEPEDDMEEEDDGNDTEVLDDEDDDGDVDMGRDAPGSIQVRSTRKRGGKRKEVLIETDQGARHPGSFFEQADI